MGNSRPVLVLQNVSLDGPAYLGTWLAGHDVAFDVLDAEAGQAYPSPIAGYRALALGGEMSANDDLPSLRRAEHVKLDAIDRAILGELQREGRLSNLELAQRVHLSPSACLRRVKALEDAEPRAFSFRGADAPAGDGDRALELAAGAAHGEEDDGLASVGWGNCETKTTDPVPRFE